MKINRDLNNAAVNETLSKIMRELEQFDAETHAGILCMMLVTMSVKNTIGQLPEHQQTASVIKSEAAGLLSDWIEGMVDMFEHHMEVQYGPPSNDHPLHQSER